MIKLDKIAGARCSLLSWVPELEVTGAFVFVARGTLSLPKIDGMLLVALGCSGSMLRVANLVALTSTEASATLVTDCGSSLPCL